MSRRNIIVLDQEFPEGFQIDEAIEDEVVQIFFACGVERFYTSPV